MSVELGVAVGIALAVACVIAAVMPLRAGPPRPSEDDSNRSDLLARRESAFQVLRDLDADFEAGKLSEEDYRPMRVQSLAQAAEIVAQLDAAQTPGAGARQAPGGAPKGGAQAVPTGPAAPAAKEGTPAVKSFVSRKRARQETGDRFCPKCGAAREADDQFCRKCGAGLA